MSILFAGMFFAAWQAAWVSLILILGVGFVIWNLNRHVRRAAANIPGEQKNLVSGIERIARNWLLIRILRTAPHEREQLQKNISQYLRHSLKAYFWGHFASSLPVLAGGLVLVVLLVLNVTFFQTPGVILLSFFYLLMRFTQALSSFAQLFGYVNNFFPRFRMALNYFFSFSVDQLAESLHPKKLPLNLDADQIADSIRDAAPRIEVKNISFRYTEKSQFVFRGFSLGIDAGEAIGIVGQSGSGKSTLLALILGVIEPEEGEILIDGQSPSAYFKNSGAKVGYVGAEAFLIEGSIKENLSYGLGYLASETTCWEALKKARLDEVILSKAEKLDFRLKENGEGLSAGQKQRLALARSFLAKPQILILDEASANLDEKTEKEIVESLSALEHSSTVIIVSHRPGILKKASRLINLERPDSIESSQDAPTQMMHSLI
jgi:ATP-binding cassette subfamily B protein